MPIKSNLENVIILNDAGLVLDKYRDGQISKSACLISLAKLFEELHDGG